MLTKMIANFKNKIANLEKPIKKLMKSGFSFSFFVCLLATVVLATYELYYTSPDLYYIGLSLLKSGFMFFVYFIICGFSFDTIKKQMI